MLTSLLYFGVESLHMQTKDIIWNVPMSQILLMLRQKELVDNPTKAFTFSDQEFIERLRQMGY